MFRRRYYLFKDLITETSRKWDNMSVSTTDVVEFAHRSMNPEPNVKNGEYFSPEYVLAHHGQLINWQLRENNISEESKRIADVIAKNYTKEPIVAYRGINSEVFKLMKKEARRIPGIDFYEKGFLCASLVKGYESKGAVKIRIYLPKESNAIYLGNVNGEEEVFYPIGVQCGAHLKLISCDDYYLNCLLVKTDGIPQK